MLHLTLVEQLNKFEMTSRFKLLQRINIFSVVVIFLRERYIENCRRIPKRYKKEPKHFVFHATYQKEPKHFFTKKRAQVCFSYEIDEK